MATRSLSQENTRVGIYARISTTNHGQDVAMQTRELEQFAQARGWRVIDSYVDEGISGSKDSRPELNRLMADAHKRRLDIVCVWRFDRFARSVSHLLRALETFKALGIDFVSFSEQMDTSTTCRKNGIHGFGSSCRVRAQPDSGASSGLACVTPAPRAVGLADLRRQPCRPSCEKSLQRPIRVERPACVHSPRNSALPWLPFRECIRGSPKCGQ